ncbi:MAG: hypothetical protein Fur0021_27010 [Candidatus Promineifilaceae bacterium]
MNEFLAPFIWVAVTLPLLLLVQRWIHRHLHGVSLLLTGNANWALILYAIVLLPGVFLHEVSHWLAAGMLGVRTGRFSLIPRVQKDGSIQLGYVEYFKSHTLGPLRESIIGGAPLLSGVGAILLIAFHVFDVAQIGPAIQSGQVSELAIALGQIFSANDFLVWFYLLFAISNAMLPSPSDRRAWPAFIIAMVALALILTALGLQQIIWQEMAGPTTAVFGYLGVAFSLALGVDLFVMLLLTLVERLLSRIKRVELIYDRSAAVSKHQT